MDNFDNILNNNIRELKILNLNHPLVIALKYNKSIIKLTIGYPIYNDFRSSSFLKFTNVKELDLILRNINKSFWCNIIEILHYSKYIKILNLYTEDFINYNELITDLNDAIKSNNNILEFNIYSRDLNNLIKKDTKRKIEKNRQLYRKSINNFNLYQFRCKIPKYIALLIADKL
jgi:histone deacetylase complex regulatory component SIN3